MKRIGLFSSLFLFVAAASVCAAVPQAPTWPASPLSRTDKSISAQWLDSANPAGTKYRLEVSSDGFQTIVSSQTAMLSATVNELLSNTSYDVRVVALDAIDSTPSDYSSTLPIYMLAAVPGLPTIGSIFTPERDAVTVRWLSNENSAGTQYHVQAYVYQENSIPGVTTKAWVPAQAQDTTDTSVRFASLANNTTYWFTVSAVHAEGGTTSPRDLGTAVTLPGAFSLIPDHPASSTVWYGRADSTITFQTDAFANGAASYIRYRWLPYQDTFTWPQDSDQAQINTIWSGGDLVISNSYTAPFYLHVKAYNAVGASNSQSETVMGPFLIDYFPPNPNPAILTSTKTNTSITWNASQATDPSGASGLHAKPYGWTFDGGAELFTAGQSSQTIHLTPNTGHTMTLRLRDQAQPPNMTDAVSTTVVTAQNKPLSVAVTLSGTEADVTVAGDFPFITEGLSGLQVRLSDSHTEIFSPIQQTVSFHFTGLLPNTVYEMKAKAFNRAGEETDWCTAGTFTTPGGPAHITADKAPYNPPSPGGIYKGGTVIRFTDDGAYGRGEVAYYKFLLSGSASEPGPLDWQNSIGISRGSWASAPFNGTQSFYAHIRSYDSSNQSIAGGYTRLGPWWIDNDPPIDVGTPTVDVSGSSTLVFNAGSPEDIGPAGLPLAPYSFDGGQTFQVAASSSLVGLEANSYHAVDIVYQDSVGNLTLPTHKDAYTLQNQPTGINVTLLQGKHIELSAAGDFPRLNLNLSGLQFGLQKPDLTITWADWVQVNYAAYDLASFNTTYTFVVRARNANGVLTAQSPLVPITTPPTSPSIGVIQGTLNAWGTNPTYIFKALDAAGPTTYDHYVYAWNKEEVYAGMITDVWPVGSSQLSFTAADSGKWYLHIRSVNSAGDQMSAVTTIGWFGYDVVPPTMVQFGDPSTTMNSVTWTALANTTDTFSGLHTEPLVWNCGDPAKEQFSTLLNPQIIVLGSPNQLYAMTLCARDALGNRSAPVSLSTYTRAADVSLSARDTFAVYQGSVTVKWRDGGNPNGTPFKVQLSASDTFASVDEKRIVRSDPADGIMSALFTGLTTNTTYFVRVSAVNGLNVETAPLSLGSVTTRPQSPSIKVTVNAETDPAPEGEGAVFAPGTVFHAASLIPFGSGTVEYLRWVWNSNPNSVIWSNLDTLADATHPITVTASTKGRYYLHAAAFSGGGMSASDNPDEIVKGPFNIVTANDFTPAFVFVESSTNTISISQAIVVGDQFAGVAEPYGYQLDGGDIHWDSKTTYVATSLEPNKSYSVHIYLKNAVPQISSAVSQTVVTKQKTPELIVASNVSESSMTLTASTPGGFFNTGADPTGFKFSLISGPITISPAWIVNPTLVIPAGGLDPNRTYSVTVQARNSAGDVTPPSIAFSVTTLAKIPSYPNIKPDTVNNVSDFDVNGYYKPGKLFSFSSSDWALVNYYKVIVDQNDKVMDMSAYDNAALAATWISNKFSTAPAAAGTYYFHFRSYNSANVGGPDYTFGPVYIDDQSPTPNPPVLAGVDVSAEQVIWTATPATDGGGAGLDVNQAYNFQYPDGVWGASTTTMYNLQPNTRVSISLVVRDRIGNVTSALDKSTVTKAAVPFPFSSSLNDVTTGGSSASMGWEKQNNSDKTVYEIGASLLQDMSNPIVQAVGTDVSTGEITGLQINTDYWFAVRAVNAYGFRTAWALVGSHTWKTKNEIVTPSVNVTQVLTDSIQVEWLASIYPVGTTFEELHNSGGILDETPPPVAASSPHTVSGLTPNMNHIIGIRAKSASSVYSLYATVSTTTLADAPVLQTFTLNVTSASVAWTAARNPIDTKYEIRASLVSTLDQFTDVKSTMTGTNGVLKGLIPDTDYYFGLRALDRTGRPTAWVSLGEARTPVMPPQLPYSFTNLTGNSMRLDWGGGTNPTGVQYVVDRSIDQFASAPQKTETIANTYVAPADLALNTTYYYRAKAVSSNGESAVVSLGSAVTLSTMPAAGVLSPGINYVGVSWLPNGNPSGTIYYVEAADNLAFMNLIRSNNVTDQQVRIEGLKQNTTYWFKLYSVNWAGAISDALSPGFAITQVSTPVLPTCEAKWNASSGTYVHVIISAGDMNPEDTLYAIFNTNTAAYLTGDGSSSPTPVWLTRTDWDGSGTEVNPGKAIHAHLSPWTEYGYKIRAKNRADVLSDGFSDEQTVTTVPGKPSLTASVAEQDYVRLQWASTDAEVFRMYVSPTGVAGSFTAYHDYVAANVNIHYIKQEGPNDIPYNLREIRHDAEGGTPAQAGGFAQTLVSTDSIAFQWETVVSPAPAPRYYYYLRGVGRLEEEGEPSDTVSAQVVPVISSYVIAGTRTGKDTDPQYQFVAPAGTSVTVPNLQPNTHLRVGLKARSSDGLEGVSSNPIDAWSLANVPGQPVVTSGFDDSHHVFLNVDFSTSGNPAHTQYAIRWVEGNKYIAGGGTTTGLTDINWLTKEEWDRGFTHTGLPTATTYTYDVLARNGDKSGGPHIMTVPSAPGSGQTISFPPPTQLSGSGASQSAILWTWMDNSSDETGFEIDETVSTTLVTRVSRVGSIPQANTGTLNATESGLPTPNTPYSRTVRASNVNGYSFSSAPAEAWTLAMDPDVESTTHKINEVSQVIKFKFKNNLIFGQGTAHHYSVKFTTSPAYVFSGTEVRWDDPAEIKEFTRDVIDVNTSWYLHVLSFNNQNTPSVHRVLGPYPLFQDVVPPEVSGFSQDGAQAISGARPASEIGSMLSAKAVSKKSVKSAPTEPQLDVSFAASIPWVPSVHTIHIGFTKRLDPDTVTSKTVLVRAIQNNLSQAVSNSQPISCSLTYNDAEQRLDVGFPQPGLPPGYLFELELTKGVLDTGGNSLAEEFRYYFRTFLDPGVDNELITSDGGIISTRIHLSAGSLPKQGAIGAETDPASYSWGFDSNAQKIATEKQMSIGGAFARPISQRYLGLFDTNHNLTNGKLKAPAVIMIPFFDEDNDGYVDSVLPPGRRNVQTNSLDGLAQNGVRIKVSNLGLYRFDQETQLWIKVPGAQVDTQSKTVGGQIYQMGLYAVLGTASNDVSNTYAYPVPFVASKDREIKFVNLPDAGEIKIYTVAGELVKEIRFDATRSDPLAWDVKNESGEKLGADVYLYQVKSGGNQKTGKLVIVR